MIGEGKAAFANGNTSPKRKRVNRSLGDIHSLALRACIGSHDEFPEKTVFDE